MNPININERAAICIPWRMEIDLRQDNVTLIPSIRFDIRIPAARVVTFSDEWKGCEAVYILRLFREFDRSTLKESDQLNLSQIPGGKHASSASNSCKWIYATDRVRGREKRSLKMVSNNTGGINGGSSVSITRGIIYQETLNNYYCLAHILQRAGCNISSRRPLAFIALVESSRFFSLVVVVVHTGRYLLLSFAIARILLHARSRIFEEQRNIVYTWKIAKCDDLRS